VPWTAAISELFINEQASNAALAFAEFGGALLGIAADCGGTGDFSAVRDADRLSANLQALVISNSNKQNRQTQNLINIKTSKQSLTNRLGSNALLRKTWTTIFLRRQISAGGLTQSDAPRLIRNPWCLI
jgi:hypothetical protein